MKPKIKQIASIAILVCVVFLTVAGMAHAQSAAPATNDFGLVGCRDNCTLWSLVLVIVRLINYLLAISGVVAMIFIVWAGWSMMSAAGNEEKIAGAKTTLSQAIIGFFLVLVAWVLINGIVFILSGNQFHLNDYLKLIPQTPAPASSP